MVIDPYQPYATAVAAQLPDARLVVDHFHTVRLANTALDEVRRRVQHTITGHRGRKDDPLYRIRRRLLTGHDGSTKRSPGCWPGWTSATPKARWPAVPGQRTAARDLPRRPDVFDARRRLTVFYEHCTSSRGARVERLARTVARWETPILHWHRTRLTNAATEGTNLIVKNIKRLGLGFRNFENYRLRLRMRCGAPWQHHTSHQYDPATHALARRAGITS